VENNVLAVLLGAVGFVLTAIVGFVWFSRARAVRRFNAAVDAYAEREIARQRRWDGPHRIRGVSTRRRILTGGSPQRWWTEGEE
jgi:hypothetical protein